MFKNIDERVLKIWKSIYNTCNNSKDFLIFLVFRNKKVIYFQMELTDTKLIINYKRKEAFTKFKIVIK